MKADPANGTSERPRPVTDSQGQESEILRLSRFYALLSHVNQSVVHSQNREELLGKVCRAAVDAGGFKLAWIGWLDANVGLIRPVAHAGAAADYIQSISIPRDDVPEGQGMVGSAIREGRVAVCNDFFSEPRTALWRDRAAAFGLAACAAFPVTLDGRVLGSLVVYTGDKDVFGEREVGLLREVAADLSFGLDALQRDAERRESERALRESEARFRTQGALLDEANDAIMAWDLEFRLIYWNKGAERLYGWTSAEAQAQPMAILGQDRQSGALAAYDKALAHGGWAGEIERLTKARESVTVLSRWTLIRDECDRPKSLFVIDRDVTERKKLESQLLRAQRLESVGQLAGGVAHDLNNILAPILTAAQLLRLDEANPAKAEMIATIETCARRGADVVRQILIFSRGGTGEHRPLPLSPLLNEVARLIRSTFPKRIALETAVPPDLWAVCGDVTQLHQLLMNLCVNARDAMASQGFLKITAENLLIDPSAAAKIPDAKAGPHVVLIVSDTGTGIPAEIMERIFDPFFTTKELGKGTGLGLSTVIGIVRSHNGFIKVESKPGQGTQFRIYLPALKASAVETDPPEESEGSPGKGETILFVDDEESIRLTTKKVLEQAGYRVLLANDGADAVVVVTKHSSEVDLVITDAMMPIMDGNSFARIVQRIAPELKIILCTGMDGASGTQANRAPNIVALLKKPAARGNILTAIRGALDLAESPVS